MCSILRQAATSGFFFYKMPDTTGSYLQDLYSFCSFVLVLQLAIFSLYIAKAKVHHQRTSDVVRNVLDTLVAAVPIGIPAVIIYSMWRCVVALRHNDIEMHRAAKIKTAAAVEVVVLDKTGTLTDNLVSMYSIA